MTICIGMQKLYRIYKKQFAIGYESCTKLTFNFLFISTLNLHTCTDYC